jgi:hypothetical protein
MFRMGSLRRLERLSEIWSGLCLVAALTEESRVGNIAAAGRVLIVHPRKAWLFGALVRSATSDDMDEFLVGAEKIARVLRLCRGQRSV